MLKPGHPRNWGTRAVAALIPSAFCGKEAKEIKPEPLVNRTAVGAPALDSFVRYRCAVDMKVMPYDVSFATVAK